MKFRASYNAFIVVYGLMIKIIECFVLKHASQIYRGTLFCLMNVSNIIRYIDSHILGGVAIFV